jgi:GTP cyclohydrolase I
MMKEIDQPRIRKAIRELLIALNDNPDRPGLIETPDRVARMFAEVYEGMCYTNDEIADMFNKTFEEVITDDMVIIGDIPVFYHVFRQPAAGAVLTWIEIRFVAT